MRSKYIREDFYTGESIYPDEIREIKTKEDMRRWFEWCEQFPSTNNDLDSFLSKVKLSYRKLEKGKHLFIFIKFPRCKSESVARFLGNECYAISIN